MIEAESSFCLTNKHQQNPGDNIWYNKYPLGKSKVGKPLSKAVQNNSVHRTCNSNLLDSDVPVIVQLR